MKRDLYAEVSARIIAELEAGAAPWIKPWSATAGKNVPCNAVTNRPYSGSNVVLLWMAQAAGYRTPRYLTFKQALELGGNVRKGEHGTSNRSLFAAPIPAGKRSGEVRDWGRISGCTGRFWATEDRAILLLRRQSRGKSKTIPTAAGNRICAGLRGGGRTPPRPVSNPNSLITGKITGNF
jgi:hypothetical protein